jgi:hypothetical protein
MGTPWGYAKQSSGIVFLFLLAGAGLPVFGQNARSLRSAQIDPNQLARAVFLNEIAAQSRDQSLWRYRELKEDHGNMKLFAVCQTDEGEIDRLLAVNGHQLDPEQRDADDQRIQSLLNHPGQLRSALKKQQEDSRQTQNLNLMRIFPQAFRFQFAGAQGRLIRLTFNPDPNFHPAGRVAQVFHHMEGRLLLDPRQLRLVQIRGQLTSDVQFFGGLLGHLDKGRTFFVQQQDLGSGHWELTAMNIQFNGKALFFKTIAISERESYGNYRQVPRNLTLQQAFALLKDASTVRISMR